MRMRTAECYVEFYRLVDDVLLSMHHFISILVIMFVVQKVVSIFNCYVPREVFLVYFLPKSKAVSRCCEIKLLRCVYQCFNTWKSRKKLCIIFACVMFCHRIYIFLYKLRRFLINISQLASIWNIYIYNPNKCSNFNL